VTCEIINNDIPPAIVIATKIVCDDEALLPNWGQGGDNITSLTAIDWVTNNDGCELAEGWNFEYAFNNALNPGDNLEVGGNGWTPFGPTDENGETSVEFDDLSNVNRIWLREQLKTGYLGFTFNENNKTNVDSISAELYCHKDVLNYDNYDFIDRPQLGNTYYCVAWNIKEDIKKPGSIKIVKVLDDPEVSDDVFRFETDWTEEFYLDVNDDDIYPSEKMFSELTPGEYSITEILPEDSKWELDDIDCDAEEWEELDETAKIYLQEGESVVCEFQNDGDEGGGSLGYPVDGYKLNYDTKIGLENWTIKIYRENCETLELPQEDIAFQQAIARDCDFESYDSTLTDEDGYYRFSVPFGYYKICEAQQEGWQQVYPEENGCHETYIPNEGRQQFNFFNQEKTIVTDLVSVCENNFPYLRWNVTANFIPTQFVIEWFTESGNDAGESAGELVQTDIFAPDDSEVEFNVTTYSGEILWPGANDDLNNPDWPGWTLNNGVWKKDVNDLGGNLRPSADVAISVNPSVNTVSAYPSQNDECNPPRGGAVLGTSTTSQKLATTGESQNYAFSTGAILIAAALLTSSRRKNKEN
jgi:LPXTG-motif cell wall-anchored protein